MKVTGTFPAAFSFNEVSMKMGSMLEFFISLHW